MRISNTIFRLKFFSTMLLPVLLPTLCFGQTGSQNIALELSPPRAVIERGETVVMLVKTEGIKYQSVWGPGVGVADQELGLVTATEIEEGYRLTMTVPDTLPIERFPYTVEVKKENGDVLISNTVMLQIEPSEKITRLVVPQHSLTFSGVGEGRYFDVRGFGESGKSYDLSFSSRVTMVSSDNKVALLRLLPLKVLTQGPGTAVIDVTYTDERRGVALRAQSPVEVRISQMKADYNFDSRVTIDDIVDVIDRVNNSQGKVEVAGDSMDLNEDGVLDIDDVREAAKLCKYDACFHRKPRPTDTLVPVDFNGTPIPSGPNWHLTPAPLTPTSTPTPKPSPLPATATPTPTPTPVPTVALPTPTLTPTVVPPTSVPERTPTVAPTVTEDHCERDSKKQHPHQKDKEKLCPPGQEKKNGEKNSKF